MRDWEPLVTTVLQEIQRRRMRRRVFLGCMGAGIAALLVGHTIAGKETPANYDNPRFEYHGEDGVALVYFEVDDAG
jgi:hypothetical protein